MYAITETPQPRLCEQYSLQPVPPSLRAGKAWPLFNIFCNFFINPGTLISAGMMVVAGFSVPMTVVIQLIAVLIGMIPFLIFSQVGVHYGIPGQVFCRAVFGIRGARWVTSILRLTCSIYWFAFQTAAGAMAIEAILRNCFHIHVSLWIISLIFALFQGTIAIIGYHYLKWLSAIAFPAKLLTFIALGIFLIGHGGSEASPAQILVWKTTDWHWPLIAIWFNTIVCTCYTCVTDASDFTRYTHSRRSLWVGMLTGVFVGTLIGALFGAYAVAAGNADSINPFETITQLQPNIFIIAAIVLVIFLDNWTINVINLYTGGLSLCNTFEKLGRFRATVLVTLAAALLSCLPELINDYTNIMGTIGGLFAPVTGIMLVWYCQQFSTLDIPLLYRESGQYWYTKGFHIKACIIIPIGFLAGMILPVTLLPAMVILLLSSLAYRLCSRPVRPHLLTEAPLSGKS